MHTAKCVLDLNRNDLADSLEFDIVGTKNFANQNELTCTLLNAFYI